MILKPGSKHCTWVLTLIFFQNNINASKLQFQFRIINKKSIRRCLKEIFAQNINFRITIEENDIGRFSNCDILNRLNVSLFTDDEGSLSDQSEEFCQVYLS